MFYSYIFPKAHLVNGKTLTRLWWNCESSNWRRWRNKLFIARQNERNSHAGGRGDEKLYFSRKNSNNNFLLKRKGNMTKVESKKKKQFYDFKISSLGNSISCWAYIDIIKCWKQNNWVGAANLISSFSIDFFSSAVSHGNLYISCAE